MVRDSREDRLPKWAQAALATSRRLVADAEQRATEARLATGPQDSDTLADPYDDVPLRLGHGAYIRFLLDGDSYVDARVRQDRGGAYVDISASAQLAVQPQSSNVIRVSVVPR